MRSQVREHRWLLAFVAAYLVAFSAYGVSTDARPTIAYALTIVIVGSLVAMLHVRVRLSSGVLWCIGVWGLLHMAGGLVQFPEAVLYNVSWGIPLVRYDRLVHAFGFGTTTVACWQVMRNRLEVKRVDATVAVFAWLGGMGVGALNEVAEFIMTRVTTTNVGGYVNTGYDLVANALGCAAVAIWLRRNR